MGASVVELVTVIGTICGVLVLLGSALVIVRGSYSKARMEALAQDINIYKGREELHEREMADCRERIQLLEVKVEHLSEENQVLRETATQKAAVSALASESAARHNDLMRMFEQLLIAIEKLGNHE